MDAEVKNYIEKRYERWLEYANYNCYQAGCEDQAVDVVNEVILSLLAKDESKLKVLYHRKRIHKGKEYTDLDFFVLRMIKLNIFSPTSPYQHKYKPIPNANVDYRKLNIEDCEYEEIDSAAQILAKFNLVREAFEQLHLCEKAKQIFEHRFFHDLPFSEWDGPEEKKELHDVYKKVEKLIKLKINKKCLL